MIDNVDRREPAMTVPDLHAEHVVYTGPGDLLSSTDGQSADDGQSSTDSARAAGTREVHVTVQTKWTPWPRTVVTLTGPRGSTWGHAYMPHGDAPRPLLRLHDPARTLLRLVPVFSGEDLLVCETTGEGRPAIEFSVEAVHAFWINCPWLDPEPPAIVHGRSTFLGRSTWTVGDYLVVVDQAHDHQARTAELQRNGGHGFTHAMRVTRVDGASLPRTDVARLLQALHLAVSFAVGRFVAPCLQAAEGGAPALVWHDMLVDHWQGTASVWRSNKGRLGTYLPALIEAVAGAALDPARSDTVRFVVHNFVNANENRTFLEQSVMSSWAALERLAWRRLVEDVADDDEEAHAKHARKIDGESATWRVRRLLKMAGIPTALPGDMPALEAYRREPGARRPHDGVQAVTWVRDAVTHPTAPERIYDAEGLLHEAYLVAQEWLALSFLHWVGYQSQVRSIADPRKPHQPVPWSEE